MPTSTHEAIARQRKVDALVSALLDRWAAMCAETGTVAPIARDALAAWPSQSREALAEVAGVKPPSEASWALVVHQAVEAGAQRICEHGHRLRADFPCPDWHGDPFARF